MKLNWRVKFKLFIASTYALVFSAMGIMAVLTGKYIETIALFISFVSLRYTFAKTYHSDSFWLCILYSIILFVVAISFVPNKNISLLASVAFSLLIDFGLYKIKDYQDTREELLELTAPKPFSLATCNESELIARCRELNLSEDNTNLAIEFFIKKTKQSILAERLCIDEKSVKIRKTRLKEKLTKSNDVNVL